MSPGTLERLQARTLGLAHEFLEFLFPVTCTGCGKHDAGSGDDGERWLCVACRQQTIPDWPVCVVCGSFSPTGRTCYPCLPKTPLAGTTAVGLYRDPILRSAITTFKFHGVRALARPLGELLAQRIAARGLPPATLIPLPLHPRRQRERGFNQAHLLADVAGALLGLPVEHLLTRTRATSPQTSILESQAVRRRNVSGIFALQPFKTLTVRRAILVDDVLTTGATLTEAARTLRTAGGEEIWAAVVARG